jgi:hypothetical protein
MAEDGGERAALPQVRKLEELSRIPGGYARCRMAGYLVGGDDEAIHVADLQGTWILPHGSYDNLTDWSGGSDPPESLKVTGRPVQLELVEGAVIYELRPWNVRKGGDPLVASKNRALVRKIFSVDGEQPGADVTAAGEARLFALEEAYGRRLGWDPGRNVQDQVFFGHHLRSASWNCESDGGGS